MLKNPMKPEAVRMRTNMLKEFMERNISWPTRDKISLLFGDTPEKDKEALAERVIALMEQGLTEGQMLEALGLADK